MKLILNSFKIAAFLALTATATAANPAWWAARGVTTADPSSNYSPATLGQAKWMAHQALEALQSILPDVASQIDGDLTGGTHLILQNGWTVPLNSDENFAVLTIGQLKALAHPFHARLSAAVGNSWMNDHLLSRGLPASAGDPGVLHGDFLAADGVYYPWKLVQSPDNRAIANLGQLKLCFDLPLTEDSESPPDGLPDLWEYAVVHANPPGGPWTDIGLIHAGNAAQAAADTGVTEPPNSDTQGGGSEGETPDWFTLTGNGVEDEAITETQTFTIKKGKSRIVVVGMVSDEYPGFTGDEIEVVDTIRFCRWLDSFTGNTLKSDCTDKDRDRFRIRIPGVVPNLTKIHIKSFGLATAVIGGVWESKYTDGDYDVTMTEENGAMVSKWMLLVSDGDDDVEYNGIGTDNGPNDQTLLANFNSPIGVTLPEYQNAKVTFHAQKPLGDLEIQPYYLSPAGDLPADKASFITNHLEKMKEIYRQIGVRVGYYGIVGKAVDQSWFDAKSAPSEAANYFTPSESSLARAAVRGMEVPGKQIRIGFVDATVMQDGTSFNQVRVRGFTDLGTDGIIVSIEQNDARTILGVTAHEVGHALGLNHTSVQSWKRWLMRGDPGETIIWDDEPLEHSKRFQTGDYEVIRNSQSFYVPYVPN